ncbi:hypothetical protein [Oceanobacillus sp. FSL W7-1281]|uniref:hypothetical protein n=1 Tax=Oceanobacillus sp. FSL W7-1281 TaxID=2921698 RepID=UPI0030DDC841
MRKTPDQSIYDAIYKISMQLGYDTFNYLPDGKAPYPFVYVGETFNTSRRTKFNRFGDYVVRVHVYANQPERNRKTVTEMRNAIENAFYRLKRTDGYQVLNHNTTGQVMDDNSTGTPLLHGVLSCEATLN